MSRLLWPLATTAVLIAVMYLTCVRPMRRHTGCDGPAQDFGVEAKRRAELAALRAQVDELRGHMPPPAVPPAENITGTHDATTASLR